jgi:hypothetical protein
VWWSYVLLDRAPHWMPWLRSVVLVGGLATALALVVTPRVRGKAAVALGLVGICAALGGPAAYALDTAATPHSGAIPSAGPSSPNGFGGAPGGPGGAFGAAPGLGRGGTGRRALGGATATGAPTGAFPGGGFGGPSATGGASGLGGRFGRGAGGGGGAGGGAGGFLSISTPGRALVKALEFDAARYTWVAATVNSNSAAGYQLATDDPVMAIGGFNGTDPAPTLSQFERDVAAKKIHYFISGGGGPGSGTTGTAAGQITQWVESHFTAKTIDGVTDYDLSAST